MNTKTSLIIVAAIIIAIIIAVFVGKSAKRQAAMDTVDLAPTTSLNDQTGEPMTREEASETTLEQQTEVEMTTPSLPATGVSDEK